MSRKEKIRKYRDIYNDLLRLQVLMVIEEEQISKYPELNSKPKVKQLVRVFKVEK